MGHEPDFFHTSQTGNKTSTWGLLYYKVTWGIALCRKGVITHYPYISPQFKSSELCQTLLAMDKKKEENKVTIVKLKPELDLLVCLGASLSCGNTYDKFRVSLKLSPSRTISSDASFRAKINKRPCLILYYTRPCLYYSKMRPVVYKEATLSGAMSIWILPTLDTAQFHIIPFSFQHSNPERWTIAKDKEI